VCWQHLWQNAANNRTCLTIVHFVTSLHKMTDYTISLKVLTQAILEVSGTKHTSTVHASEMNIDNQVPWLYYW